MAPATFRLETTTVWSFPERGTWATHDGSYRGNWSPYLPRNLLLRYTAPGDLVLDPFVGGGTTAVEAALLGRRLIAGDLNLPALARTKDQLDTLQRRDAAASPAALLREDARALAVADASAQLVLLHPPYADAIRYSTDTAGDLSHLAAWPFVEQLRAVAAESLRVLAPDGRCALLMGDLRKQGHVVPLGFAAIQAFRQAGLALEELLIKHQHHTRMAERWSPISARRGFLLLAHEYLAVFRRADDSASPAARSQTASVHDGRDGSAPAAGETTVWAIPTAQMDRAVPELVQRVFGRSDIPGAVRFVRAPPELARDGVRSAAMLSRWLDRVVRTVRPGDVLAVETRDVRRGGELYPLGLELCRELRRRRGLRLKEIVAVVPAEGSIRSTPAAEHFAITHRYLLIATRGGVPFVQ